MPSTLFLRGRENFLEHSRFGVGIALYILPVPRRQVPPGMFVKLTIELLEALFFSFVPAPALLQRVDGGMSQSQRPKSF